MVHTFFNTSFEFPSGEGAFLISEEVAPFLMLDGDDLLIDVAGTLVTLNLNAADGVSAAATVATLTGQSPLIVADVYTDAEGDHVRLTSVVPGGNAEMEVLGGRAQSALVYPRGPVSGVTYAGTPWAWTLTSLSASFSGMEFDSDILPDVEAFTYGWGLTYGTYQVEQQLFTAGGYETFIESFNGHEVGWENAPLAQNVVVALAFSGEMVEVFDHYATPSPTYSAKNFVSSGSIEYFDNHFSAPAVSTTPLTFAGSLAKSVEDFAPLEPGTHRLHTWIATFDFVLTVNSYTITVLWAEVVASGVPALEQLLYAQQLMLDRLVAAEQVTGMGGFIVDEGASTSLFLYPKDSTSTPTVSGSSFTIEPLPGVADLEEVWHFKDIYPPDAQQI